MADGAEFSIGPGDLFSIPAGHDSWVIGEEEYISLHFLGAPDYARQPPRGPHPHAPGTE